MPIHKKYAYREISFDDVSWVMFGKTTGQRIVKVEYRVLCGIVKKLWPISGAIYNRIIDHAPELVAEYNISRYFNAAKKLAEMQRNTAVEVSSLLSSAGFKHVLLKGAASAELIYQAGERMSGDIDVGVTSSDAREAHQFLRSQGFVQSGYDKEIRTYVELSDDEARRQEEGHHELCMLVRRSRLEPQVADTFESLGELGFLLHPMICRADQGWQYVEEIDLHHGLFPNISCDEMIDRSARASTNGVPIPSAAHHFCHVVMKLYWEAAKKYGKGAHQVPDLWRLCSIMSQTDWEALGSLLYKYNMLHAGYYLCSRLASVGADVPRWVVDDLGRQAASRWELPDDANDFGDVWDKIWWLGI